LLKIDVLASQTVLPFLAFVGFEKLGETYPPLHLHVHKSTMLILIDCAIDASCQKGPIFQLQNIQENQTKCL